jgi:hypothetical protein
VKRLPAALGDRGDRVHTDDRADEEEQDVEATEVPLEFLPFGRCGDGHRVQQFSHQVSSG